MIYSGYFAFSLIHLELKRQTRLIIRSRGSPENHTRFQNLYPFLDQSDSKKISLQIWGGTSLYIATEMSFCRGVPPREMGLFYPACFAKTNSLTMDNIFLIQKSKISKKWRQHGTYCVCFRFALEEITFYQQFFGTK